MNKLKGIWRRKWACTGTILSAIGLGAGLAQWNLAFAEEGDRIQRLEDKLKEVTDELNAMKRQPVAGENAGGGAQDASNAAPGDAPEARRALRKEAQRPAALSAEYAADVVPRARKDPFALEGGDGRVGVPRCRQRPAGRERVR